MNTRRVETQDELLQAVSDIADSASRRLMFFLPDADAGLWSSPALLDTLRGFVTARSHREASWLFGNAELLPRDQGPLVALTQRLPSLIPMRRADPDFSLPATQSFVVNDLSQLLLLDSGARVTGTFTDASERARPLVARFDDAWERAKPLSELRALGI